MKNEMNRGGHCLIVPLLAPSSVITEETAQGSELNYFKCFNFKLTMDVNPVIFKEFLSRVTAPVAYPQ